MNYRKVSEKYFIGAFTGAISAAAAIQPRDGEDALRVLLAAFMSGGIMGILNAYKHRVR